MKIDINGSFEQGWTDLPPTGNSGFLVNQQPKKWQLSILPPGAALYDSSDKANGEPECVHKLLETLPSTEHPGQPGALILDGKAVYKIFNSGAAYGAELRQVVSGLQPGTQATLTVPILVDRPKSKDDPWHTEFNLDVNGQGGWWNGTHMPHKQWRSRVQTCTVDASGQVAIRIRVKSKYQLEAAFFLDALTLEAIPADVDPPDPPDPPPTDDIEERVEDLEAENGRQQAEINALRLRVEALENTNPEPPPSATYPALCVDVSAHNNLSAAEWKALADGGVKIAIIRSSNGMGSSSTVNGVDKLFWSHMNRARENGIKTAVYHFYNERAGVEQIDLWHGILKEAKDSGYTIHSIWLDFEESSPEDEQDIRAGCEAMLARCAGIAPHMGIYTRKSWWDLRVSEQSDWPRQLHIWTAAWLSSPPQSPPLPVVNRAVPHHWSKNNVWQFTSQGGAIFCLNRGLDVNWFLSLDKTGKPPTVTKFDLLPYLKGDGRLYEVRNSDGGQERHQTHDRGNGVFWQTKNTHAEMLYVDGDHIWRDWDTSPGNGRFYRQQATQGTNGAKWIPRRMAVGEVFVISLYVQFYTWNCNLSAANSGSVTDTRRFVKHYGTWTSRAGITLSDVIELEWVNGGERYFYAKGFGLVAWERTHQDPHTPQWSAISEIHAPGQRPDNAVDLPGCLL